MFTQFSVVVGRITPNGINLLGTAFLISNEGLYATSRHVIGNDPSNIVVLAPHIQKIGSYQDVSDNSCRPITAEIKEIDPIKDIAVLKSNTKFNGPVPSLGSLDEVSIGETVGIFGYPHCVEGRRVLTYQSTEVGAKILLESSSIKSKHAVLNIQSRPGQSGSMVFSLRQNKIVAMLVGTYAPTMNGFISVMGINPAELNQTTHVISAEYIKEML